MHELERIEYTLANNDLDPDLFERCAQDLLTEIYPGLSPIPGGTDWGRDADLHGGDAPPPPRLMVTKSRDSADIQANMVSGLESLTRHAVPFDRIVIANPGSLSGTQRSKLRKTAAEHGANLEAVYDRGFFASRLRRDGEWRQRLLGLSADPVTVSRIPSRLAESPWSQLPLVGRMDVLDTLKSAPGDVIVTGKPGVGKTRLLAELPDVVFVDPDAADDRLADDLRWIQPGVVVIDDVGQAQEHVRLVQRLRRQEADWLNLRIVAVCWPDELEAVRDLLPGAQTIEIDLLERGEIDAIVRAVGITGVIARHEILNQAEGRAGWAVALSDLLLRSGWDDLVTGKAVLGQVDGYLRRSQLSTSARDLLAVVAALRGVSERELTALADAVGVSRSDAGRLLRIVSQGGLLDVEHHRGRPDPERRYSVRPPMLADAIATEHYMLGDPPLGDIDELLETWPDRAVDVVATVCTAARLGAKRALARVDALVDETLARDLPPELVRSIYEHYLLVNGRCAARVVERLIDEFERLDDMAKRDGNGLRPLIELAYIAAARYLDRDAVSLMLKMATFDDRPTNPHPEHPLRKLADLCTHVHPDRPPTADHRVLVGSVIADFLPPEPTDAQWRVWATVAESVLTPHARGTFTAPEDMYRFSIIETIVQPPHARAIHEQLWPPIYERLKTAPTQVAVGLVTVVHEWLRVGGGYDQPFGRSHPQDAIERADEVGRAMFSDLVAVAAGRPPLIVRVVSTASMFDIEVPPEWAGDSHQDPFFRDRDRLADWDAAVRELEVDITETVTSWAAEPPDEVVRRLVELRAELKAAGVSWPDRVWLACRALAEIVDDARIWVKASLEHGLFPDAGPFLDRSVSRRIADLGEVIEACLADASARSLTLGALLASPPDEPTLDLAISRLVPDDYRLLDMLMIRGQLAPDIQVKILRTSSEGTRGAFAVALAGRTDNPSDAIPADLLDDFLAAILHIRPAEWNRTDGYQLIRVLQFLAAQHSDVLEELIRRCIAEARPGELFRALGDDIWRMLHVMPRVNKMTLLNSFPAPEVRWFLLEHLVGPDADWLEELLDAGFVTPEEALGARGFHEQIPIDRMAKLLIPRGIDASRIAARAFSGFWTGPESARYQSLVDRFATYAESDDPSVSAVGSAGVDIFTEARDEALQRERQRRIRGQF